MKNRTHRLSTKLRDYAIARELHDSGVKSRAGARAQAKHSRQRADKVKLMRSRSSLLYLLVIGLCAAAAADLFQKHDSVLLFPMGLLIAGILAWMSYRKRAPVTH